jgi:hypothetical protein
MGQAFNPTNSSPNSLEIQVNPTNWRSQQGEQTSRDFEITGKVREQQTSRGTWNNRLTRGEHLIGGKLG